MDDQSKFSTAEVLAVSCAIHEHLGGYLTKTDSVTNRLLDHTDTPRLANSELLYAHFFQAPQVQVNDYHRVMAEQVSNYIKGLAFKTFQRQLSEYEKSLLLLVNAAEVTASQLGIGAGVPNMYFENIRSEAWNRREAELAPGTAFFGEPGDSVNLTSKLEYWKIIPRTHSTFMIASVKDQYILKFFLTSKITSKVQSCTQLQIVGEVKSHVLSTHSAAKITQIHRALLVY